MASNADQEVHPTPVYHEQQPQPKPQPQPKHHNHRQPPPPKPQTGRRRSLSFSIPTPNLVDTIPEGGHYHGGLPTTENSIHENGQQVTHRRSQPLPLDDPVIEERYGPVLNDLEEIYCGRATSEIMRRRFSEKAVFEDPFCIADGYDQVAAQWFALPTIVSKAERTLCRILSASVSPNTLVIEQTMEYTVRLIGIKRIVPSIIRVELDEDFKITRLEDQWYGQPAARRWGASFLRRLNAKVTPWFFHAPKEES